MLRLLLLRLSRNQTATADTNVWKDIWKDTQHKMSPEENKKTTTSSLMCIHWHSQVETLNTLIPHVLYFILNDISAKEEVIVYPYPRWEL